MGPADEAQSLAQIIEALTAGQPVALEHCRVPEQRLAELGFSMADGQVRWPSDTPPLSPAAIAAHGDNNSLRTTPITVLPVVGSTNDWLRSAVSAGADVRQAVTTECQIAGKGRLGRSWATPVGGSIALSLGMRLQRTAPQLGGLSLVIGLAVVDALDPDGVLGLGLKWPNDVLADGRKLGGILIEILTAASDQTELMIGIGINHRLPRAVVDTIDKAVIDLQSLGQRTPRNALIAAIMDRVDVFVTEFEQSGFAPFADAFRAAHQYHGREARVLGADSTVEGVVQGVDTQGRLLLATANGVRHFNAGEVSLREH